MGRRIKVITVSSKNYKWVTSRLEKFFNHEKFLEWSHFDGGMKKHISSKYQPCCYFDEDYYPGKCCGINRGLSCSRVDNSYLNPTHNALVLFQKDRELFAIQEGMRVAFLGNRVIICEPYHFFGWKNLYHVYQILK